MGSELHVHVSMMLNLFQAGYRNNTLGLPKLCPEENISKVNASTLYTYLKNCHTPERMVLAGVGKITSEEEIRCAFNDN